MTDNLRVCVSQEFTVQSGQLFMLQCRDGKRTGAAALRIAIDLVEEGVVTREDAIRRLVTPSHLDQLLHPTFALVVVSYRLMHSNPCHSPL